MLSVLTQISVRYLTKGYSPELQKYYFLSAQKCKYYYTFRTKTDQSVPRVLKCYLSCFLTEKILQSGYYSTLTFILLEFRLFCVRNSELTFLVARFQNWLLRSVFVYKLVDFCLASGKVSKLAKSKWQNSVKSQIVEERKVDWDWGSEFRFIFWQKDNLIKEMVSVLVYWAKLFPSNPSL